MKLLDMDPELVETFTEGRSLVRWYAFQLLEQPGNPSLAAKIRDAEFFELGSARHRLDTCFRLVAELIYLRLHGKKVFGLKVPPLPGRQGASPGSAFSGMMP